MKKPENAKNDIIELESRISALELELEELTEKLSLEKEKKEFYQFVADFTFGWEVWFNPDGNIKYCSPSCIDLTGYTANQIMASEGIESLLVFESDKLKFYDFVRKSLDQMLVNQSLEFRILTRTKQLRWCNMSVRGVYDKKGKYLGIRASIQDITRLKKAMGHIQEMQSVKELELRSKERMQTELKSKDRELVTFLLLLSQKNDLFTKILNTVKSIDSKNQKNTRQQLDTILELLETGHTHTLNWQAVENQLEKIHPDFFNRLQLRHPSVSIKEKRLCAYIRLGLTSKEISGLLNITFRSVEIARVRLRKKLRLTREIQLSKYLVQL